MVLFGLSLVAEDGFLKLPTTFYNYENRALSPASFRPKLKTANGVELAANTSCPIFIVDVGVSLFLLFFHNFQAFC